MTNLEVDVRSGFKVWAEEEREFPCGCVHHHQVPIGRVAEDDLTITA